MKYFVTLIIIAGVYTLFMRSSPIAPVPKTEAGPRVELNPAPAQAAASPGNFLKRPLDRAHAVVEVVRQEKSSERF